MVHHFLVYRSLDPPGTQLVLDILIMALEIAALRDDIDSLTLVVSDRELLPRLAGHGYPVSSRTVMRCGCRKPSAAIPETLRRERRDRRS